MIQAGTSTPCLLAASAQAKKLPASLMAYDSASDSGTTRITMTATRARVAASVVRPPNARTRRWNRGQVARPMISAANAGTRKPLRK